MTTDDKDDAVEGSWSPRRPRKAVAEDGSTADAAQDTDAASKDPEALASDIERTREELAETLDAIADKVSPKRVAKRTTKKVGDSVKSAADSAQEAVKTGAAAAVETVKDATESVKDATESVKDKVGGGEPDPTVSAAHEPLGVTYPAPTQETVTLPVTPGAPLAAAPTAGALADASAEPVVAPAGSEIPPYRPAPPSVSASKLPVYAGAAAALAAVLFLLRRRRR